MASEIVVSGLREFSNGLRADVVRSDIAARNIVTRGGEIIATHAKRNFRPRPSGSQTVSKRTGRVYYKGAPNFPAIPPRPTMRSGALQKSTKVQSVVPLGSGKWMSSTGPSVMYGGFVNYGTSRARPFPFLTDGLRDSATEIAALAEREWATAQA